MYMEDPMHLKAMDVNMTMEMFLMNDADNPFRGIAVEDRTTGIALREYPSDGFNRAQDCAATMRLSMKMVSLGRRGAIIPTAHPTWVGAQTGLGLGLDPPALPGIPQPGSKQRYG